MADYLSRIICGQKSKSQISKCFPDQHLFIVHSNPWFADMVNYLVSGRILEEWTKNNRDRLFHLMKFFVWMICTCLNMTKFSGGACLTVRLEVSSHFVMTEHAGGI